MLSADEIENQPVTGVNPFTRNLIIGRGSSATHIWLMSHELITKSLYSRDVRSYLVMMAGEMYSRFRLQIRPSFIKQANVGDTGLINIEGELAEGYDLNFENFFIAGIGGLMIYFPSSLTKTFLFSKANYEIEFIGREDPSVVDKLFIGSMTMVGE